MFQNLRKILRSTNFKISDLVIDFEVSNRDFEAKLCSTHRNFYPHCGDDKTNIIESLLTFSKSLRTQPERIKGSGLE